jgi:trans-aconitate methyltransferase
MSPRTEPPATDQAFASAQEIIDFFNAEDLTEGDRVYLRFAARRYAWLMGHVRRLINADKTGLRILEIGPSFSTELLRAMCPAATVDSLGLRVNRHGGPRPHESHTRFDLNDTVDQTLIPQIGPYDLVVMAEVIEHLYTAPETVLSAVAGLMAPGSVLVVQTPNALALHKRLQMLAGKHPFGPIGQSRENPLHFREYTAKELQATGAKAGLRTIDVHAANYFERGTFVSRSYNAIANRLPRTLRAGITVTFERPA